MAGSRSLRHTIGSSGMMGEGQMILICSRACGEVIISRCRSSLLLVAAATCLLATAMALAWWLALRTVLKQDFGSMPLVEKIEAGGTRKPGDEVGETMA